MEPASLDSKKINLAVHVNDTVGLLAKAFKEKPPRLGRIALFDSLTGLPHRKSAMRYAGEAICRANRSNPLLAFAYNDLNGFKEINDLHGHQYGDELLILFARNLRNATRETDFSACLCGDEFAIISENCDSKASLYDVFSRFAKQLSTSYFVKDVNISLTIRAC